MRLKTFQDSTSSAFDPLIVTRELVPSHGSCDWALVPWVLAKKHGSMVKELDTEELVSETHKLLRMEIDELYAALGVHVLVFGQPTKSAGIVSYLSSIRNASEATVFLDVLPKEPPITEWARGLGIIHGELKNQGQRYLAENGDDLRKGLCNEDILAWSDEINRSTLQILLTIVAAALRMPRELDSISALILAIIIKIGLRKFCEARIPEPSGT